MMVSMFSIFDPSLSFMSMSWLSLFLCLFFIGETFFILNYSCFLTIFLVKVLFLEFINMSFGKGWTLSYFLGTFFLIFIYNFSSLFPLVFPLTSHFSLVLPLAVCFWMFSFLFYMVKHYKNFFSHLLPYGTPVFLMMFMVVIEIVSMIIRPITLTVRLVANITAGHLLLYIMVNFSFLSYSSFFIVFIIIIMMSVLEMFISLIQSYVFLVLVVMYSYEME